jgi:hypothetical protein
MDYLDTIKPFGNKVADHHIYYRTFPRAHQQSSHGSCCILDYHSYFLLGRIVLNLFFLVDAKTKFGIAIQSSANKVIPRVVERDSCGSELAIMRGTILVKKASKLGPRVAIPEESDLRQTFRPYHHASCTI